MKNDSTRNSKVTPAMKPALAPTLGSVESAELAKDGDLIPAQSEKSALTPVSRLGEIHHYDRLFPVKFHDDTLILVDHEGTPHVIMRTVVENLGLAWPPQYTKMIEKFGSTVTIIVTVAEDGKQREMISLPLRKFPAWLYSLTPSKVAPSLRGKIVLYQDECDEVLWQYWTNGIVVRPGVNVPTIQQQISLHGLHLRLMDRLEAEGHPVKRKIVHEQLAKVSALLDVECPAIDSLGVAIEQPRLNGV